MYIDGSLAGDVGFDPLGFSSDSSDQKFGEQVKYMRNAELKHARLAMLAGRSYRLPCTTHPAYIMLKFSYM